MRNCLNVRQDGHVVLSIPQGNHSVSCRYEYKSLTLAGVLQTHHVVTEYTTSNHPPLHRLGVHLHLLMQIQPRPVLPVATSHPFHGMIFGRRRRQGQTPV